MTTETNMTEARKTNVKVALISHTAGFLTKGVETRLEKLGIDTAFLGDDIKLIEEYRDKTELYVLYVDETVEEMTECLVFLKDIAGDTDRRIIIIGEKEHIETALGSIPSTLVHKTFLRPLDMDQFLKCVENYVKDNAGENRKKHILIVDDDITYMRMIYDWLRDKYHVGMASSGVQAITWLAKNKADLVLLDYEMPVANGPQVLQMLRGDSEKGDIPVMFLTGKGDRESVMSVLSLKPVDYLLKTIDKEALLEKLGAFFEKTRKPF